VGPHVKITYWEAPAGIQSIAHTNKVLTTKSTDTETNCSTLKMHWPTKFCIIYEHLKELQFKKLKTLQAQVNIYM
jgi:hypothetical protein